MDPIRHPRLSSRATRARDALPAGKRCRLPIHRPPRGVELVFQLLVFAGQPLPLRFRPPEILAQAVDLPTLLVDDLLRVARARVNGSRHRMLMPDSRAEYKRKLRTSSADPLT
jgi:hypothetical protein